MLPFDIPAGTSLDKVVTEVVPAAHAKLVPASAGRERVTVALELTGVNRWVIELDGASMKVREGDEKAPDIRITARGEDAQAFLDDWTGPRNFTPKGKPPTDMLLSDPRVLKRVKMVTGTIELSIRDFDGAGETRKAGLTVSVGGPAKKVEPDPDVTVETSMATYRRMLGANMSPEDALADGDVKVAGKRLVAMQFAFAVGPLFPPKKGG